MKILNLVICCISSMSVFANSYYFSSSAGNDSYTSQQAQNVNTPWKTLNKLNSVLKTLQPGDAVLFKKGDVFYGNIIITSGNIHSIVLDAYGNGANPIISGFTNISNWNDYSNDIKKAACDNCGTELNMLVINEKEKAMGRTPNADQPYGGYLSIESAAGNTSITDSKLQKYPNFSGGQIVIRKIRWVLDRNLIQQQAGNIITYQSESGYNASPGYGYFIQDHINTLDKTGEWFFDKAGKNLFTYFGNQDTQSLTIKAGTIDTLVNITGVSNITFKNIQFEGANKYAFQLNNDNNITISNCNISWSGINAINAINTNHLIITNTKITYTNNIAVNGYCSNSSFINDTIQYTGIFPGMGNGDSGSYEAFLLSGNKDTVKQNVIDSVGYIPITFSGDSNIIQNNVIQNFTLVKDDGGGIYTWNNSSNATEHYGNIINGNIILNGRGAPHGTDNYNYLPSNGIYIDDNAGNVSITNNTIANCKQYGIFIHNAHNAFIKSNTSYNNAAQLAMIHDNVAADKPVSGNTIKSNLFFTVNVKQPAAMFQTINNDINNFGTFDSNYYCRPFKPELTINTSYNSNGNNISQLLNLNDWKTIYNQDKSSKEAPVQIPYYIINTLTGNNKFKNGSFDNDISGLYCYSSQNNCATAWNSSDVLDKGNLQLSFSPFTSNLNYGSIIIGIDSLKANTKYIVRFSTAAFAQYSTPQVYFRQSQSPYADLSDRTFISVSGNRSDVELMLISKKNEPNASLVFDISDQAKPLYLDNIQVYNGNITKTNPNDSILFLYNDTPANKVFPLYHTYTDVTGKTYQTSVTLKSFASVILMRQSKTLNIAYNSIQSP